LKNEIWHAENKFYTIHLSEKSCMKKELDALIKKYDNLIKEYGSNKILNGKV
jgi:hypothetical protein